MEGNEKNICLHRRFITTYKKHTAAVFFSFVLTLMLLTSMTILIQTNFHIGVLQDKTEFTPSDCYVDNLSQEQTEILKGDLDIAWMALEQSQSALYERNRQRVFLTKTDSTGMTMMGKVTEGRLPQEENEVAAERWTLLNLGIEPEVNKSFTVLDQDTGQEKQLLLTGILTDIYANKKYGLLSLYGTLDREKQGTYLVYLKFQDNTDYEEKVKDLEQKLGVTEKDIKDCPARTDLRKLYDTEIKVLGCLFLVCMVVVYGIYRILALSRLGQYGVLRALGMKKKEVRNMLILELYEIYLWAAPTGLALGIAAAWLVMWASGDRDMRIYLLNEEVRFQMVVPGLEIFLCVVLLAFFIGVMCFWTGKRMLKLPVISMISGEEEKEQANGDWFEIQKAKSKTGMLLRLSCKYIIRDRRTSGFLMLMISVAAVLFTCLAYKAYTLEIYRQDTREMYYLNGDYAMTMLYFDQTEQGISRENAEQIQELPEVSSVKTSSSLPIRVVDEENVGRNQEFYNRIMQSKLENYGYSDAGFDGENQVYKSLLCGYNDNALKALEPYVTEGKLDLESLGQDQIILSVLQMDSRGENQTPGFYKEGTPLMDYHAGDTIQIKYRKDFQTSSQEYESLTDSDAEYVYREFQVAAIVSFPYMYDCNRTLYPLLITRDACVKEIAPQSSIQCMYLEGKENSSQQQDALERKLIRLGSQNQDISTRSLIGEKQQNEMFYYKQMVYIYGITGLVLLLMLLNLANHLRYRMQIRSKEICMLRAVGLSISMTRKIFIFENLLLALGGELLALGLLWPALNQVYKASEMEAFSHSFTFPLAAFSGISGGILVICGLLSSRILKLWKTREIARGIGRPE